MLNILLTGGYGFIGSHLYKGLIQKGYSVFRLKGNILNTKLVENTIRKNKIKIIIHLAALLPDKDDFKNPFPIFNTNVLGTLNLIVSAYRNKVKRFIYASTMSVYSEPSEYLPVDEKHPTRPLTIYGASKLSGEIFCNAYSKLMDIVILRLGGVYGQGEHKHNASYRFKTQALKNKPITIYGNGKQSTDFISVDDVVKAGILSLKLKPDVYNIGSGQETTIKELAKRIIKMTNSKSKIIYRGKSNRPFRFYLDVKKYEKSLNNRTFLAIPGRKQKSSGIGQIPAKVRLGANNTNRAIRKKAKRVYGYRNKEQGPNGTRGQA